MDKKTLDMVGWFRHSAPYIHAHRGKTFVLMLPGDAIGHDTFTQTVHDIALLNNLGVKLVLAVGARAQIDDALTRAHVKPQFHQGLRITDTATLQAVVEAASAVRTQVEALLSIGLINSPMHGAQIHVAGGNFITAKPIGVRDGIDFHYTGEVRHVDVAAINVALNHNAIVILPCLGYSSTGEIFNLSVENLAAEVTLALNADKLIAFVDSAGLFTENGELLREIKPEAAQQHLTENTLPENLRNPLRACLSVVSLHAKARAHLISYSRNGALLEELFTREGNGTLLAFKSAESIRKANVGDAGGILELIAPLEADGVLVRRSRDILENEIDHFTVMEYDGLIAACIALYPYADMAEVACIATHPHYQGSKRASALLDHAENQAHAMGIKKLFVLTTQTAHWFLEKGFIAADLSALPAQKQHLYNYQRNSKIFIKTIQ